MSQNAAPASPKQPARPVTSSLLGIAPELVNDPLGVFSRLGSLGDVVAMPLGIATAYLLNRPEYAQHVFANHKLYGKQIDASAFRAVPISRLSPGRASALATPLRCWKRSERWRRWLSAFAWNRRPAVRPSS